MLKKIFFIFLFFIVSSVFVYFIDNLIETRKNQYLKAELDLVRVTYKATTESFETHSDILFENKINTKEIIEIVKELDKNNSNKQLIRKKLYNSLIDMYSSMKKYKLKQLHFHLKNNYSFLRFHRPSKFGDDLTDIRQTVSYVNETKNSISGFEEGRIFNAYRFVYPMLYQDTHLGSVEISVSMSNIIEKLKKELSNSIDFVIKKSVVDRKVFTEEKKNYRVCDSLKDFYHEITISKFGVPIIEHLVGTYKNQDEIERKIKSGRAFNFFNEGGENLYITTFFPIKNAVSNETVGYLIVSNKTNEFTIYKNQYLLFQIILIFLTGLICSFFYKINEDRLKLNKQNKILKKIQRLSRLGHWEYSVNEDKLILSDEVYRILEVSKNMKLGFKDLAKFIHEDDITIARDKYMKSLKNKRNVKIEYRIRTQNNNIKYISFECRYRLNEDKNIIHTLGTVHDITKAKSYQIQSEKTKEKLQSLVSNIPEIVYQRSTNQDLTMIYLNQATKNITGYEIDDFMYDSKLFKSIIHKDDLKNLENCVFELCKNTNDKKSLEYRITRKNGEIIWLKDSMSVLKNDNEVFIEGIISDITHEKKALRKLEKFIDKQDNIVILTNGESLNFANKTFLDFFDYMSLEDFKEDYHCICDLFIEDDKFFHLGKIEKKEEWIFHLEKLANLDRLVAIKDINDDGKIKVFAVHINDYDDDLKIVAFSDVSETINEQLKLESKVIHDKLTGAYNREYFETHYKNMILDAKNAGKKFALCIFDIDHFKKVNDNYGHDVGDYVLIDLVKKTNDCSRADDIVVRWGGEEFLFLLKIDSKEILYKVLEGIRKSIEEHNFKDVHTITCSFGAAFYDENENIEYTIKEADKQLYKAKNTGRNKVLIK